MVSFRWVFRPYFGNGIASNFLDLAFTALAILRNEQIIGGGKQNGTAEGSQKAFIVGHRDGFMLGAGFTRVRCFRCV
jgi:hypothetical protein